MSMHTLGPWITDDADKHDIARYVMSDLRPFPHTIARLELGRHRAERAEQEANARLMAAAPELLEALEEMLSAWDEGPAYGAASADKARAAIAKATGGEA